MLHSCIQHLCVWWQLIPKVEGRPLIFITLPQEVQLCDGCEVTKVEAEGLTRAASAWGKVASILQILGVFFLAGGICCDGGWKKKTNLQVHE